MSTKNSIPKMQLISHDLFNMEKCKMQSSFCVMGCDRKIKNRIYLIFNNKVADMLMVNIFNYMQIKYTRHIHVLCILYTL